MRSIQRLLQREGLPEKLRVEKMREMEALTKQGVENKQVEREKAMATKYHKVKFFERVKLTRAMEKLERDHPEGKRSEDICPSRFVTANRALVVHVGVPLGVFR